MNRHVHTFRIGLAMACAMLGQAAIAASPTDPQSTQIESRASVATVFACFRQNASFPSFAHLTAPDATDHAIYRLRFERELLEQVDIRPAQGGGSRIVVTLSGQYAARDLRAFDTKRGRALTACANSRAAELAHMTQQVQP